jgi:hypothetical protein
MLAWLGLALAASAYNYGPIEENAGSYFSLAGNPSAGVYELDLGVNRHFLYTPLHASYFLLGAYNDLQGSTYAGAGAGLRLMPWPNFSPFLGGGAAFDYGVYKRTDPDPLEPRPHTTWFIEFRAEAGLRYSPHSNEMFFELFGQYRYGASVEEGSYWLAGFAIGTYLDATGIGISRGDSWSNRSYR